MRTAATLEGTPSLTHHPASDRNLERLKIISGQIARHMRRGTLKAEDSIQALRPVIHEILIDLHRAKDDLNFNHEGKCALISGMFFMLCGINPHEVTRENIELKITQVLANGIHTS